jgi:Cytochrome C assembly protein
VFDLEQTIQTWRQALPCSLTARAEVVEELESHLREEFQRLVHSGIAPEQAWPAALKRLGPPQQLAGEFDKVPEQPAAWLPARLVLVLLGGVGCLVTVWLGPALLQGQLEWLLASHIFAITVGYTAMFALGLLAVWSLLVRAVWGWDTQHAEWFRSYGLTIARLGVVLSGVGVGLGAWWARDHLGHWWDWDAREIGGLAVVLWFGVAWACLSWRPSGRLVGMVVGVLGNIIVCLSWFGPVVFGLSGVLHAYGAWHLWPYLAGFILLQLLILLLGLIPARRMDGQRA